MKKVTLYRSKRDDGGVTISPELPIGKPYTTTTRLIAERNFGLVNEKGVKVMSIDTDKPEEWTEVYAPELWEGLEEFEEIID